MSLLLPSYLAGMLTILAPCVLPVLPFVFSRADRPFLRNGLPMMVGMGLSFAVVATLAAMAGEWVAAANDLARWFALGMLAVLGLFMLLPAAALRWLGPLSRLGDWLSASAQRRQEEGGSSLLAAATLGVATGLLWAPCAGPVLGLVLATAAIKGPGVDTTLLLCAYAAGAVTSLAVALWAGGRAMSALRRLSRAGEVLRKGLGAAVLAGVAAIGLGLDTGALAQLSAGGRTERIEQRLLELFQPSEAPRADARVSSQVVDRSPAQPAFLKVGYPLVRVSEALPNKGSVADLSAATAWINAAPLTPDQLKGKVVLVEFWTFGCINCRNAIPYVRAWHEKYKDQGLVVVGVHAPEFAYERKIDNVKRAAKDLNLGFPIAIDNSFSIWRAFSNQYWPALYLIDAQNRIRYYHAGEGQYERSEAVIRQLLQEAKDAGSRPPAALGTAS